MLDTESIRILWFISALCSVSAALWIWERQASGTGISNGHGMLACKPIMTSRQPLRACHSFRAKAGEEYLVVLPLTAR